MNRTHGFLPHSNRTAALVAAVLLGALALRAAPSAAPAAAEVMVTGQALAASPNRATEARLDAMRQAVGEVAGRQVRSLALTSYHQLAAQYTVTKLDGFVERAEPAGPPEIAGDLYHQRFRIVVRPGAVNRDLVEQKLDVDFLYEVVARPRIALALEERWKPEASATAWQPDERPLSQQAVIAHFKARHDGFIFKDLDLLRDNQAQTADYVREAARNSFDVLIVGRTRSAAREPQAVGAANPWTQRRDAGRAGDRRFAFDAELEWRVVNVATAETLLVLSGSLTPDIAEAGEQGHAPDAAARWAKEQLLAQKVPELFRELLAYWNRRALGGEVEVVFEVRGTPPDPEDLAGRIRSVAGLDTQRVQLVGLTGGELVFSVQSALGGSELAGQLGTALAGRWRLQEARSGRLRFIPADGGDRAGLRLVLGGLGLAEVRTVEQGLRAQPGIHSVTRDEFAGGRAVLTVFAALSAEDVAAAAEALLPGRLRVEKITTGEIVAAGVEPRP